MILGHFNSAVVAGRLRRLLVVKSGCSRRLECVSNKAPATKKTWLNRMAPPKGGTELPDARFMAVFTVVCALGFYAWFIDPPKQKQLHKDPNTTTGDSEE